MLDNVFQIKQGMAVVLNRAIIRLLWKREYLEARVTAQELGDTGAVGGKSGHADMLAHSLT
jgi:hypothetical protein